MVESLILMLISFGGTAISYLLAKAQERTDERLTNLETRLGAMEQDKIKNKPVTERECADRRRLDIQKRNDLAHRLTQMEMK